MQRGGGGASRAVMGFGMHHGVCDTARGEKCIKRMPYKKGCVRCNTAQATQLGMPSRLWQAVPLSPNHCVGLLLLIGMLP